MKWFSTNQPQLVMGAGKLSLGEVIQGQLKMERGEDLVQPQQAASRGPEPSVQVVSIQLLPSFTASFPTLL